MSLAKLAMYKAGFWGALLWPIAGPLLYLTVLGWYWVFGALRFSTISGPNTISDAAGFTVAATILTVIWVGGVAAYLSQLADGQKKALPETEQANAGNDLDVRGVYRSVVHHSDVESA